MENLLNTPLEQRNISPSRFRWGPGGKQFALLCAGGFVSTSKPAFTIKINYVNVAKYLPYMDGMGFPFDHEKTTKE